MIISFEGIDGCGKSTVAKAIYTWLTCMQKRVTLCREPEEPLRSWILNRENHLYPESIFLMFMAARAENIYKNIVPTLDAGGICIVDRYIHSTYAYQIYGMGLPAPYVKEINDYVVGSFKPDLTFYLACPAEVAYQRIRNKKPDRFESMNHSFFARVAQGYELIAQNDPKIQRIDATMTFQGVLDHIKASILKKL